ncbi:hypothetical protein BIFANG_02675 [Bifidobacterium angulatum DSM 20098 = JCM 7096]|uniref:Uncharacterized protein n=1 Tax=Bifidobacterium angulatum DSM 20098 = JCM 7096 TaxID=518635 RepID=C4FED5_9BIFI|nr:hypothetical protein BIFANG_02675 [Bifidobacterium angulatum DSM 20098 = JCM 7096]
MGAAYAPTRFFICASRYGRLRIVSHLKPTRQKRSNVAVPFEVLYRRRYHTSVYHRLSHRREYVLD